MPPTIPKRSPYRLRRENVRRGSFLYALGCGPYIKIGVADEVEARRISLQGGNPHPTVFLRQWVVGSGRHRYDVELAVHTILRHSRVRGEWLETTLRRVQIAVERAVAAYSSGSRQLELVCLKSFEAPDTWGGMFSDAPPQKFVTTGAQAAVDIPYSDGPFEPPRVADLRRPLSVLMGDASSEAPCPALPEPSPR